MLPSGAFLNLSVVVLVPLFYNPDRDGIRRPVEDKKIIQTKRDIRRHFCAGSSSRIGGWWRDDSTGEEFDDELIRFEIDFVPDPQKLNFLKTFKRTLEKRFQQRAIYIRFAGPVGWV